MICYHCGESVPEEATHCYYCGASLSGGQHDEYEDSIDDLLGSAPAGRGYDFLDEYEPVKSRALPIALSIFAAVLLIFAGIYLLSQSNRNRQREEQLNRLTLPSAEMREDVPPVVASEATDDESNQTTEAVTERVTEPSTEEFRPPTLPEYRPVNIEQQTVEIQQPLTTAAPTSAPAQATPAAGGKTYTVVAGDSFWSVAQKEYGTASMELAKLIASANNRAVEVGLRVGETIAIPPRPATPTPAPVELVNVSHVVAAGESYWSLATKYYGQGSAQLAEKIAAANGRTSSTGLKVGETLSIPDVPKTRAPQGQTAATAAPQAPAAGSNSYVVQAGDSYWSIATAKYGTANYALAEKIASANGRTINDRLNVGETLVIPPR
jgi:nucleoid-associated protein YgaU